MISGLLSLVMVLGMAACGGGDDDELTADVTMDESEKLRYDPNELEIKLNQETTFTFLNKDDQVHNITVPGLSNDIEKNPIELDVQPGQRGTLKLPAVTQAPRDGFFLFYCKYHQTEGMSGRLKISG